MTLSPLSFHLASCHMLPVRGTGRSLEGDRKEEAFFLWTWFCSCRSGRDDEQRERTKAVEAAGAAGKYRLLGFCQLCQRSSDNTLCTLSNTFFLFTLSDLEVVATSCSY